MEQNAMLPFESSDVCLVSMPYAHPFMPSLALGLLQASLIGGGFNAKSIYANLMFMEKLGFRLYERNHLPDARLPLAEWSFSAIAFPDFHSDEEAFIAGTYPIVGKGRKQTREEYRDELRLVRRQAEIFIDDLAKEILRLSPKIVGCSSSLSQRVPSLALLRKIHELDPGVVTLMGGADCEKVMGLVSHQHFPWVDFVMSGEGEDLIVPLVRQILKFGRDVPLDMLEKGIFAPVHRQSGYDHLQMDGDAGFRSVADSFERQITPFYDDYFETLALQPELSRSIRPVLPVQASRGCWYGKCNFCGLNACEVPYRSRPGKKVLSELDELNKKYGISRFEFLDNVLDKRHINELLDVLEGRGAPYTLFFEIRTDLSKEQIRTLRAAGMVICQPGIESLHSDALKAMKKGVTAWQNIQTLKWCRQYGIKAKWSILHDIPGDMDQWYREMAELVPMLSHLCEPMGMLEIQYHRSSPYFEHADDYRLRLSPLPLDSLIYPLPWDAIKNLSYILDEEFIEAKKRDPRLALLFAQPGLYQLKKAVNQWILAADSEDKPMLSMKIQEERILISDTRPAAVSPFFALEGIEREIYLLCDAAQREQTVRQFLQEKGYSDLAVDAGIHCLTENKLLAKIDDRLLALAVEAPYNEYVSPDQSPLAWVKI